MCGHAAGVHRRVGGVQGENRILGQLLDSAFLRFGFQIQKQTEVFRHGGSHSALRQGAGNRLEEGKQTAQMATKTNREKVRGMQS